MYHVYFLLGGTVAMCLRVCVQACMWYSWVWVHEAAMPGLRCSAVACRTAVSLCFLLLVDMQGFLFFRDLFIFICECFICIHVHVYMYWCPRRPKEGIRCSGIWVMDSYKPSCGCWGQSLGPLQQCCLPLSHLSGSSFIFLKSHSGLGTFHWRFLHPCASFCGLGLACLWLLLRLDIFSLVYFLFVLHCPWTAFMSFCMFLSREVGNLCVYVYGFFVYIEF